MFDSVLYAVDSFVNGTAQPYAGINIKIFIHKTFVGTVCFLRV